MPDRVAATSGAGSGLVGKTKLSARGGNMVAGWGDPSVDGNETRYYAADRGREIHGRARPLVAAGGKDVVA